LPLPSIKHQFHSRQSRNSSHAELAFVLLNRDVRSNSEISSCGISTTWIASACAARACVVGGGVLDRKPCGGSSSVRQPKSGYQHNVIKHCLKSQTGPTFVRIGIAQRKVLFNAAHCCWASPAQVQAVTNYTSSHESRFRIDIYLFRRDHKHN
jgi:hypothetical protein